MAILKSIFSCAVIGARKKSSVAMLKSVIVMMNLQNAREITMKMKSGYVVQYASNDTIKTVFFFF